MKYLILLMGLFLSQLSLATDFHAKSKTVQMEFRGPAWRDSLRGLGALNQTRTPAAVAATRAAHHRTETQVGPLRLSKSGLVPPRSFTGSLSRIESSPSF